MSFSSSCKDYKIITGVLHASCRKLDDTFQASQLKLDDYVGVADNKLQWGQKWFSVGAESPSVNRDGFLTAKYKSGGKTVEYKLDLNQYIKNTNGVLEPIVRAPSVVKSPKKPETATATPAKPAQPAVPTTGAATASGLTRGISIASTASTDSASSAFSATSATSTTSSSTSVSTTSVTSKSHFSSSAFRSQSKYLLIEETCTKFELRETSLHVECQRIDGSYAHSHIDLDNLIGLVDGHLQWDYTGFSKQCFEYALDGLFLVVKFKAHASGDEYHMARLDLRKRLRNCDGVLVLIELNKKLSVMLSEVPWMKFKVIAEPDLSVFANHPVMQETLVRIAETTVEHVTVEMHKMLTIAMETAITAITASAMKHVSSQIELLVHDAVGCASASASVTEAEGLHIYGGVCGCGRAYGHTGVCGHKHAYGYGDAYRHATAGIHTAHQSHANGNGNSNGHPVVHVGDDGSV